MLCSTRISFAYFAWSIKIVRVVLSPGMRIPNSWESSLLSLIFNLDPSSL
jgi:hypothetical protein